MAKKEKVKDNGAIETPETKVAEISKEIERVEQQAASIVVKSQEDYEKASAFLSDIVKPRVNRIKDVCTFFTEPYVEQRRIALAKKNEIEDLFNKQLIPLTNIEDNVKRAMSTFLREQDEAARKEEKRLADLRDKQNERREEKGQAPVATPLPTIERPKATVASGFGGKTTAKKVMKFEIIQYTEIGEPYKSEILKQAFEKGITESVIRKAVGSGVRAISGVRIYEDFDISATAAK